MIHRPSLHISDYDYPLPESKIAQYPAQRRQNAQLLVSANSTLADTKFSQIAHYLPPNALLVRNNTRVIHARLQFAKPTGAAIQVFCLEPQLPVSDIPQAMQQQATCVWKCLIGNAKKWKSGTLQLPVEINSVSCILSATLLGQQDETFSIRFHWQPEQFCFAQIIESAGNVPLPPYIHRPAEHHDSQRYQTVFADHDGSVAAPTAGLHFTRSLFRQLTAKNIKTANITLHVGAGTFKPVAANNIQHHQMHPEQVIIDKKLLQALLAAPSAVIAVGTTSVRALESLYWLGIKYLKTGQMPNTVAQWEPYQTPVAATDAKIVLQALLQFLLANKEPQLRFSTQVIILPGYRFRIINGMVTNFHQPKSTLLLLISAFLGPQWKTIYEHALQTNYRFLSYGDACLFLP
ncbi:MAG: S-adenosylmethionine:tRNA ribosyltransferase-isomerase [Bacteroidota bacterium]